VILWRQAQIRGQAAGDYVLEDVQNVYECVFEGILKIGY